MVEHNGVMKQLWLDFKQRPLWRKILDVALVLFAAAGAAILGAWALYQLGVTNNNGAVDKNYRYMVATADLAATGRADETVDLPSQLQRLAVVAERHPVNARLMLDAIATCDDPLLLDRMLSALAIYTDEADTAARHVNAIPWMAGPEWAALKEAIVHDSALIAEAGRLTGVEPRLIVGCLIGEQIRLFNSKREMFKKYLGPVKVLSVQSQFSYGVNGIKDFTAKAVEDHLQDPTSEFYMGPAYEHLLDFETADHETERYNRLVDYRNHLYSYIYTGCILHQTMLQWRRAGYDISDRPDLLFTLFNLGFSQSHPKPDPMPGGSTISVGERDYTFGAIGFDFYYSGELVRAFPYHRNHFSAEQHALSQEEIERIQDNMSDCARPERGLEYHQDSAKTAKYSNIEEDPDPFGIDHSKVHPTEHTAQ